MKLYASNGTTPRSARHYARLNRPQEPLTTDADRPSPKTETTLERVEGATRVTQGFEAEAGFGSLFGKLLDSVVMTLARR